MAEIAFPDPTTAEARARNAPAILPNRRQAWEQEQERLDAQTLMLARDRFAKASAAEGPWREKALQDRRFAAGDQWEEMWRKSRNDPQNPRPCLTINQLPRFIRQVTNAQRQNQPAMAVHPRGYGASADVAKVLQGLLRRIEVDSHADVAYDTAMEMATIEGRGFWRITTVYTSPWDFTQELQLERIMNPMAVYLDPTGRRDPDYHRMQWAFVVETLSKEELCDTYQISASMYGAWESKGDTWVNKDECKVADYYAIVQVPFLLLQLTNGQRRYVSLVDSAVLETDEDMPASIAQQQEQFLQLRLLQRGVLPLDPTEMRFIAQERRSTVPMLQWDKINGHTILERRLWPGQYVPIVPVLGNEVLDDQGNYDYQGIVRNAIDPQRLYNYWRALALDTPLPTPTGWTTMGDVQVGDELFDEWGHPCPVIGVSEVFANRPCYKVCFDDGSSIVADATHLWTVEERTDLRPGRREWHMRTLTTAELDPSRQWIYVTKPLGTVKQELPLHPYVLGVWLGDGTARDPNITAGLRDVTALRTLLTECGVTCGPLRRTQTARCFTLLGLRKSFTQLGLLLQNKHIPTCYLRASYEQRLALLQGLMDTDGSISPTGQCLITTTLPTLRDGIAELLRSVGIKAVCAYRERLPRIYPSGKTYPFAPSWQFAFSTQPGMCVFRLPRKVAVQRRKHAFHPRRTQRHRIVAIESVRSVPVKCLAIDTPSHLYLAGPGMVPTHNSCEAETITLAPKAPYIGTAKQFKNHEHEWATANTTARAYLPYEPDATGGQLIPPPQRQAIEPPIQAMSVAAQQAAQDLYNTIGITPADLGEPGDEKSGKAIRERKAESELGSSHYFGNLARGVRHSARILLDLIPFVYSEPNRILEIIHPDESRKTIMVHPSPPGPGEMTLPEELEGIYNLSQGEYMVVLDTGPSVQTQRQETGARLIDLARAIPQIGQIGADLIVATQDFDGADELAQRLKRQLPPQIVGGPEDKTDPSQVLPMLQGQLQQTQQQMQQLNAYSQQIEQRLQQMAAENHDLKQQWDLKQQEIAVKREEIAVKAREIELRAAAEIEKARLSVKQEEVEEGDIR